jgi:diacylglycerol kinase (ATP)
LEVGVRELILVVNPRAGRGAGARLAPLLKTELGALGFAVHLQETTGPRHATELVRTAFARGAPRVAIAGGDGSIFEAVNGWMQAGAPAGAALGLLPIGTGNDFVKMLGLSGDWRRNCAIVAADRVQQVDLGRIDDRWFANGVGVGFDAQVALAANRIRWLRGTPVYAAALLQTLVRDFCTPRVQITHDGGRYEDEITLAAFANGRCYGGAFNIAPGASIDDGLLEMVVAKGLSRLASGPR